MSLTFADTHNMVAYLNKSDVSKGFNQVIDFVNDSYIKYALTINPHIYVSCIKQFWNTIVGKQSNDITRLQALVDKEKVVIMEATIRDALRLNDAEGVDCLPNEEIFAKLARMGYEKPSTKLAFYKAFFSSQWKFLIHTILQSIGAKCTSWNEFSSAMASAIQDVATDTTAQGADTAISGDDVQDQSIPSPTPPTPPPQQPQDLLSTSQLKRRVKKLEKANKVKVLKLKRLKKVYKIDMDHALKVLSMQDDEPEVNEVVDVVTTAKLITKVVTAASKSVTAASITIAAVEPQVSAATITAALVRVAAASTGRRKGVVIRDPK
nr:xylulose kinase-1 [Tanacetum cinerariifolium]